MNTRTELVWVYGLMAKILEDLCKEPYLKGYIAFALTILKLIIGNSVSYRNSIIPKQ